MTETLLGATYIAASSLLEPGEEGSNIEYERGMFELMARLFPAPHVTTAERAEALRRETYAVARDRYRRARPLYNA